MTPRPLRYGECIIQYGHPLGQPIYELIVLKGSFLSYYPINPKKWKDILQDADTTTVSWNETLNERLQPVKKYAKAYCMKGYCFKSHYNATRL